MITYRAAKFSDVESIHKLLNDYAKAGLMLPRSRNAIYENLRDYIVAVQGSHLVGCGALHFVWDRLAEIRSLAVDPELKCTGIGKNIVALLEKEGMERGVKMFFTLTYQPGFFAKCNYIETRACRGGAVLARLCEKPYSPCLPRHEGDYRPL